MSPRRILATLAAVVVALGLGGFVGTASAATPPPNDLIGGATVISSLPFVQTLDTTGATTDADDTQVNATCGAPATNNSVWFKFTAGPGDTLLAVDTSGSTFSSGVIIATGLPGALTTQSCGPVTAQAPIASGKTYYVLAFDDTGSGGTLHISIHGAAPAPPNDWAIHATAVPALPYHATVNTTGATIGAADGLPRAACGAPAIGNSVWYKFTAGPNDTQHLRRRLCERLPRGCVHRQRHSPGDDECVVRTVLRDRQDDAGHYLLHHALRLPWRRCAARSGSTSATFRTSC